MNKNLISFAVAGILAGGVSVAQAGDVTVFGNVNVSIDSTDSDAAGGTDDINMENNTSAIGVKGSEDLGNGMKAIFLVDFGFDADEGSGTTARDQWAGLSGNLGQLRFGTISTSYKSHGAMIDPIYRTSLQNRDNGLQSNGLHNGKGETRGRMNNHVRYDSPDMNGLGFTVDYSFDEEEQPEDNDSYGIGGHYKYGGILVFADYITTDDGDRVNGAGNAVGDDAWKMGGSFQFSDMFGVYGQYEEGSLLQVNDAGTFIATDDANQWMLGASATMGGTTLYLGYGQAEELDGSTAYEHDAITLAVDHKLSKRTDVYAGWSQIDRDYTGGDGETDLISVGMRHKF